MTSLILSTALALSMDAFAVSVSCGVSKRAKTSITQVKIGLYFGIFQGLMPIIGWVLASRFSEYIRDYDHWIAFILLGFIGIKMIREARDNTCEDVGDLDTRQLFTLAVATSIDALAAGISFAVLDINIFFAAVSIAAITFLLSFLGARFGQKLGSRFQQGAEIFGGTILIAIGLKILVEHLFM